MKRLVHFFATFESTFAYVLVVFLTILLSLQIVNRYVFHTSFVWVEEIARISFVWMIYFCVASAAREDRHVRVGIVDLFLPEPALRVINHIADFITIGFSLVVVWLGVQLIQASIRYGDTSPVTEIPMWLIYAVIPFCFALIAYRILSVNIRQFRGKAVESDGAPTIIDD